VTLRPSDIADPLLTNERAALAVSLGESHFREFKSGLQGAPTAKQVRPATDICKDIAATLVAFANADGGELLIGVEDSGDVTGLNDLRAGDIDLLLRAPKSHVHADTPLQSVHATKATLGSRIVLYFSIPKSNFGIHLTSDGKCLQRRDLESLPVSPQKISFDRRESRSREYDRDYIDGVSLASLDANLVRVVANQISPGMSAEKCLQYLGLADYDALAGLRLRRAALLLFAQHPENVHPRLQVRILKIKGVELGSGANYNVTADVVVRNNVLNLINEAWDQLRTHLVQTKLGSEARFEITYMYPEHACREALVNAIAHRDYSDEGQGIEIFVFDDRIELRNPGGLLSPISVDDIQAMKGVHQSRNSYISRTLRETGFMRELGEGMRRIFELMKSNELAPPHIESRVDAFSLALFHRPMYSAQELLWLEQYERFQLSAEQKAIVLLGRKDSLISPQDIWDRLGLVDTEHYRLLVSSLQKIGVLETRVPKKKAQDLAKKRRVSVRAIPRFVIALAKDIAAPARKGRRIDNERESSGQNRIQETYGDGVRATLFVGNLPPSVNERDILGVFDPFGEIARVTIPQSGNRSKGYGFVEFESADDVRKLMDAQPVLRLGPYTLVLRHALPRMRR